MGLERAAWLERRFGARIEWRPFDLHPEYPPEGIPRAALEQRYGPGLVERQRAMFEQAGLPFAATLDKIPNSRKALALAEFAADRGGLDSLHPRLFDAYWGRGRDLGEEAVLVEEAGAVGLGEAEVRQAVQDKRYVDRVEAHTRAAVDLGAGGVPAWAIDQRLLVPGAQPHEVFEQVLERLGHSPVLDEPQ